MAKTTDELFAEATEADYETIAPMVLAASDTEEEFQFRIDEHLRTITIPEKGVVAGVEGDLNVNIARFTMVRYYHGRDLSKLNIRINYRNANGQVNYYTVSDATISGDSIVFSWEYAADVTQYKGNVQFVVYLFSATNAVLKQRFFSTLGTLEVLEGLEVDSSIPASEQTDILLHLKKDLSAYAEEVKKSLPADYTAMTEQVGSLKEDIVEEEFLKKGIAITKNIQDHKGLYPLGYNLTPSFGFGSFCATDLNISNTCPIVLWWGNVIEKGNELDCWYPLLPRRISNADINPFNADWEPEEIEDDGYDDIFDTCPECGCGISLRNDGGNGFCIDCAWKH